MFKKINIISVAVNAVLGVAAALLCFYLAVLPALNDNATYKQLGCVYSDSAYHFVAPSPVQEQVEEIKAQPSVKSVYEYYFYSATVYVGDNSARADAMFSESDNLAITPFNDSRLISGNTAEHALFLTSSVANKLGAKVGDTATVSVLGKSVTLPVGKIFLDDDETSGKVIFKLTESVKNAIYNGEMRLAGVYIEANDAAAVKNYLNSYVPMGRLLTRDYFDSDLQYETYKQEFLSQNYSSLITEKSTLDEAAKRINEDYLTDADDMLLKGALILGAIMFAVAVLNLVAILAYDKFSAAGSGFTIGLTRKTIITFALFALVAMVCCAGTFAALYAVNTAGLLFVNSFNLKIIGFGILAILLGGALGIAADVAVCALRRN